MKLVEILAKELGEWPDDDAAALVQDSDRYVCGVSKTEIERIFFDREMWCKNAANYYLSKHELATDHATAIVTREMWQAERDRAVTGHGVSCAAPIQWRDRIREIDATIEATTAERDELVSKLAGEGFALIAVAAEPVEDMSDSINWKVGDLIECIEDVGSSGINVGGFYKLTSLEENIFRFLDDDGCGRTRADDDYFRWHSRPTA